jgi:hypothetical protein
MGMTNPRVLAMQVGPQPSARSPPGQQATLHQMWGHAGAGDRYSSRFHGVTAVCSHPGATWPVSGHEGDAAGLAVGVGVHALRRLAIKAVVSMVTTVTSMPRWTQDIFFLYRKPGTAVGTTGVRIAMATRPATLATAAGTGMRRCCALT